MLTADGQLLGSCTILYKAKHWREFILGVSGFKKGV